MNETSHAVCVGIIMDGNRRWAKAHNLPSFKGHEAGEAIFFTLLDEYQSIREQWGTAHYIFYAFSTENWSRAQEEIAHLMGIFEQGFKKIGERLPRLIEDGVKIRFLGERERFSPYLQSLMNDFEQKTAAGTKGTIAIALSYSSRADMLQAMNRLTKEEKKTITENDISHALWTRDIPAPDLIIRTGGEKRLSNFLMWESVYSELAFTDTLWPDFSRTELEKIFSDYASRERRYGK